jgi:peptidoglycan/LPS O-acetylase OafA/YrhL
VAALPEQERGDYRPDIDGLRAIAVLVVLFFHLGIGGFSGGYVGVDMFFVISGFLITRQIVHETADGEFSLMSFYERRVRRLVPALLLMLVVSLVAGAVLLLPQDFAHLARNAASAGAFLSNFSYWMQTDYFHGDAKTRVLLHTWSLGVEEQFYLTFPLILLFAAKLGRDILVRILVALTLLSFAACVWMSSVDHSTAFYLFPFRAWEFLIGALLALGIFGTATALRDRHASSIIGLLLILTPVVAFDDMTPFPAANALLPCLGAMLLIRGGADTPVGRLLSTEPLRFVGRISYSVYLWHWPLIVFANYVIIRPLSLLENLGLAALSLGLGYLSWRFVEQPFRRPVEHKSSFTVLKLAGAATAVICGVASLIYVDRGMPERFPERTVALASYTGSMNPEADKCGDVDLQLAPSSTCTIGDPGNANVMLWGDSHAGTLFGALQDIGEDGQGIVYGATPQCPPLFELGTSKECLEGNRRRLEHLLALPEIDTVIIAARWSLYLDGRLTSVGDAENNVGVPALVKADGKPYPLFSNSARDAFRSGLDHLVDRLLAADKQVVLVYPVPETGFDIPSTLALMDSRGQNPASFTIPRAEYVDRQQHALTILDGLGNRKGLTRVYPDRIFCPDSQCLTYAKGAPLYFDSHHLSIPGARMLAPSLERALAYADRQNHSIN